MWNRFHCRLLQPAFYPHLLFHDWTGTCIKPLWTMPCRYSGCCLKSSLSWLHYNTIALVNQSQRWRTFSYKPWFMSREPLVATPGSQDIYWTCWYNDNDFHLILFLYLAGCGFIILMPLSCSIIKERHCIWKSMVAAFIFWCYQHCC